MALLDIVPLMTGLGAFVSSGVGLFFDRRRKRQELAEPALLEQSAVDAVDRMSEVAPDSIPPVHGHHDQIVGSKSGMVDAMTAAIRDEFKRAGKRSMRVNIYMNLAVFVAGVCATVTITLLVHPLK